MRIGNIRLARTFWQRLRGLMFLPNPPDYGLLFLNTRAIHMHFMRFAIDVVVLNRNGGVVSVYTDIRPWTIAFFREPDAFAVLEVPVGTGHAWAQYLNDHPEAIRSFFRS